MKKKRIKCDRCPRYYEFLEDDNIEEVFKAMGEDEWSKDEYDVVRCPDHKAELRRIAREMVNV